jgi:hypothetical protein
MEFQTPLCRILTTWRILKTASTEAMQHRKAVHRLVMNKSVVCVVLRCLGSNKVLRCLQCVCPTGSIMQCTDMYRPKHGYFDVTE